jgi:ribonuclease R
MKHPSRVKPKPTKEQVLAFIRENPGEVGKREIARAFSLDSGDRIELKRILRELEDERKISRGHGRSFIKPDHLPEVARLEISGTDSEGDLLARPLEWTSDNPPPRIFVIAERKGFPALGVGDEILARLREIKRGVYEARPIKRIEKAEGRLLGVYRKGPEGGRLQPTDRREKSEYEIFPGDENGAEPGELVAAEPMGAKRYGLPRARIIERLGSATAPKAISRIVIRTHDIPEVFPEAALRLAEAATAAPLGDREDLRQVPLITIDGEDARDFDDAVWASPDPAKDNRGGWLVLVAIADVAWYVRPGDALDRAAFDRGNSVYFPDQVIPMLPEALSNGWCSLKPEEERPCMAVHMRFNHEGEKIGHRFVRGLMKSAARLTYTQVQAARDGNPDATCQPLLENVIAPLYGAFAALDGARRRRETLELDIPERKVILGEDGKVASIAVRERFDSHRLIEEFMIAANVAAAETLEKHRQPCMYRIHDQPTLEKLTSLREFLDSMSMRLPRGERLTPGHFNRILRMVVDTPNASLVNTVVLRSQAQAAYSPENIGHFGLNLARYAHLTSPIRRYSDLLVHRGLISGLGLGEGGLPNDAGGRFVDIGEHISLTERRAATAEREAVDRFTSAWMADRVGAVFKGRVNGVTRFGLFVTLSESGADGLVPISTLPSDYYVHDEKRHSLVGRRTGNTYRLGDAVEVRLAEAMPITGGLVFNIMGSGKTGPAPVGKMARRR